MQVLRWIKRNKKQNFLSSEAQIGIMLLLLLWKQFLLLLVSDLLCWGWDNQVSFLLTNTAYLWSFQILSTAVPFLLLGRVVIFPSWIIFPFVSMYSFLCTDYRLTLDYLVVFLDKRLRHRCPLYFATGYLQWQVGNPTPYMFVVAGNL